MNQLLIEHMELSQDWNGNPAYYCSGRLVDDNYIILVDGTDEYYYEKQWFWEVNDSSTQTINEMNDNNIIMDYDEMTRDPAIHITRG